MYIPNQDQITQCPNYLHILMGYAEGVILLTGDFNCILDPQLDSTMGHSSVPHLEITRLKKIPTTIQSGGCVEDSLPYR